MKEQLCLGDSFSKLWQVRVLQEKILSINKLLIYNVTGNRVKNPRIKISLLRLLFTLRVWWGLQEPSYPSRHTNHTCSFVIQFWVLPTSVLVDLRTVTMIPKIELLSIS